MLEKSEVDKKIKIFNKNKKNTVIVLSTFDKKSVSKLKAKLLNYVSWKFKNYSNKNRIISYN